MRKYRNVEVAESELEDLVRRAPEFIEDGLRYIDHQAVTDRGPLDVLMADSGDALVVAELKVDESDSMLVQGIDYYDYIVRNVDGYASAYSQHGIDASQDVRLFLIAPSFSVSMLNRVKWVDIPISLFAYQCIKFEDDNDVTPVFREIQPPSAPERIEAYSADTHYNYITDKDARSRAQEAVKTIQEWDTDHIVADAIKYAISIKYKGSVLAYFEPRRQHFLIATDDPNGVWTNYKVESDEDLALALEQVNDNYRDMIRE